MQLGVIGLGTMGANLARNAARNGVKVAVFNRTTDKMKEFIKSYDSEGEFVGCSSYEEMIKTMDAPRAVLIMVKAGEAVDAVIEDLLPLLEKGDLLIDGGNSHYPDTVRRTTTLKEKGIGFLGVGVSGGEEGALNGPSMMPGGDEGAYKKIEEMLQAMAADDGDGGKCVTYIGEDGAGHFVKMVHNGIEYGVMQLLAESYDILKHVGKFTNDKLADAYAHWAEATELKSFLMEITADIFNKEDDKKKGGLLIDVIKDAAGQKGTGKWTTQAALKYGVAIPTINASVDARIISGSAELRVKNQDNPDAVDHHDSVPPPEKLRSVTRHALELSILISYMQGFELMKVASEEEGWDLDLSEIARIWRGGCIVRSSVLGKFQKMYSKEKDIASAGRESIIERFEGERQLDWRRIINLSVSRGVPLPAMTASLGYYDALKRTRLPQNLIQAQRDYFGAHTFERIDKDGTFHAEW